MWLAHQPRAADEITGIHQDDQCWCQIWKPSGSTQTGRTGEQIPCAGLGTLEQLRQCLSRDVISSLIHDAALEDTLPQGSDEPSEDGGPLIPDLIAHPRKSLTGKWWICEILPIFGQLMHATGRNHTYAKFPTRESSGVPDLTSLPTSGGKCHIPQAVHS